MESKKYRVQPLLLGEAEVGCALDVFWGMNKEQGRVTVPILAFLIEGGTDPILVDAGMRSAERAMSIHRLGPHRLPLGMSLPDQLAKYGVNPEDVKTVILTHLHYDQCGGCELLPNACIVVRRSELAAAAAPMGDHAHSISVRVNFSTTARMLRRWSIPYGIAWI